MASTATVPRRPAGSAGSTGTEVAGGKGGRWVATVLVWLLVLLFLVPFYWLVVLATNSNDAIFNKFPPPFFFSDQLSTNWVNLTNTVDIVLTMAISLGVAITHTALVLFFCSLVGFAFARFTDAPGAKWMWRFVLATIFIPAAVGLIPWYMLMSRLGWVDTWLPLIIPNAVTGFAVFWMRQFITQTIPAELYDAAKVDGASEWRTYAQLVLPLIRPGLGALGIFSFMSSWTALQIPLIVLNSKWKFTYPVALMDLSTYTHVDMAAAMLGSTISIIPVVIAFMLFARQFMAGLTAGALKG